MLVLCSEPEHLSSPWGHSEWICFLEMADASADKRLIPFCTTVTAPQTRLKLVCLDEKKNTVLALFKWAKTSLVPLAETTSVTVHEDRVSPWWPPLVLSTFLGLYAFFIGAPVFAAIYIMHIRRHFRKVLTFTITPGKRYRLYWDENEKLAVEEL